MNDKDHRAVAERCVHLALDGLAREYPNKIAHVLNGPDDVRSPRELTPVFYGCFDWHSAVHMHWMLARCCRSFPDGTFVGAARARLGRSLVPSALTGEIAYLEGANRHAFERPYGLAWLLQLAAELHEWSDADVRIWSDALEPLERIAAARFAEWLPRLSHPVRTGEHGQTAFALALVLDWSRARGDAAIRRLVERRTHEFYGDDAGWPLAFEPSGHDFLSPSLAEADLMRRVLDPAAFADWLDRFLPELRDESLPQRLSPVGVTDAEDGKLAHLDGLNLSRAWMAEGIARGLPVGDPRREPLELSARRHAEAGLAALTREGYMSTHWLGSFAVYLITRRGR